MPRGQRLTDFEKGLITAYHEEQWSNRRIAEAGRSHKVVNSYLADPQSYGQPFPSVRPSVVTARDRRRTLRAASNSTITSKQIKSTLQLNYSTRTVRRVLEQSESIVRMKMSLQPRLTKLHKEHRRDFVEEKLAQQVNWSRIIWSDEKKFNLDGPTDSLTTGTISVKNLEWPACSPDLNPIENLWGIIVRDVYHDCKHYNNSRELKIAISSAWSKIPTQALTTLANSVPKRLIEVVKHQNNAIDY
ncbi:unnamed protein product [Cylicocyclus nassatus]|uniref:Transposable element Tc3 transposase-like DNA-binding HTH domain-containing protein n=1 Tax=Cylicocyclus nassatus TaxID=53992 RepID=A0AA36HB85_CYLNA|nr:unnamed protein product [Cylicocyclus nassatus]